MRRRLLVLALLVVAGTSRAEDADELYQRGAYGEAAKAYEDKLEKKRVAPLLVACGNAYARAGALDKAIARYEEALRLEPGRRDAQRNLGRVLYRAGRYAEAAAELARGQGDDPAELRLLGSALQLADDADGAVLAFERAALLRPTDARVRRDLASAYSQAGRAPDAVRALRVAIARDPDDFSAWEALGRASLQANDRDGAIVALSVAARLGAAGTSGLDLLGDLEREAGYRTRAKEPVESRGR